MGTELLTGEYKVTLDEKGRISLPASLRKCLGESALCLTKGPESFLRLYTSDRWNEMKDTIMDNTDEFSKKGIILRQKFIGSTQEVEVDKAGRIPIAMTLRQYAGLSKECIVLGQINYIEIWDEERWQKYNEESLDAFTQATEELSNALKGKKGDV